MVYSQIKQIRTQTEYTNDIISNFTKSNAALLRMPTALEVGQTCLYLASDNSSDITGQCINVDCGVLPQ